MTTEATRSATENSNAEIIKAHYRAMAEKRMVHTRYCEVCGADMAEVMRTRLYCSKACKSKGVRQKRQAYVRALEAQVAATSGAATPEGRTHA